MRVILSHVTGNENVRNVASGLHSAGLLKEFFTSVAFFSDGLSGAISNLPGLGELRRRRFPEILRPYIRCHPWREILRVGSGKLKLAGPLRHEVGFASIDQVFHSLDRRVAKRLRHAKPEGAYAYEDGALATFSTAKTLGISCLYDLPIGYWRTARRLLEAERERWPEWATTLTGFKDSPAKLARKDEELALADHIFVASSFTRRTLEDYPGKLGPVHVIPYGFPEPGPERVYDFRGQRPLRMLFVGGLSQRKGIADVFAAAENLGKAVELTVVGRKAAECPALDQALARHRWIPSLPHDQVLALMRTQDVLVFPSLFEGFGLVITEAMSQGTPVITTDRTAGPDLIDHGRNGWLIPAATTGALEQALDDLVSKPGSLASCGAEARASAARRPWSRYGDEVAAEVADILNRSAGPVSGK